MTTFQTAILSKAINQPEAASGGTRAYLQERLRNRLYHLVIDEFMSQQIENPEFTQAALARRIDKRPEQVNRWLSSPGNWTIDTISDLLFGIAGAELEIGINYFADQAPRNFIEPEWLNPEPIMHVVSWPTSPIGLQMFEVTDDEITSVDVGVLA